MNNPLVTIIMPARNVGAYICDAIESVVKQHHTNWQLIIIENASDDDTREQALSYRDNRIIVLSTETPGLSNARNIGLQHARGSYICFLDADDRLPENSISARVMLFEQQPELSFVDGIVRTFNYDFSEHISSWKPSFTGIPYEEMALLMPQCFSGITWMVKKEAIGATRFDTNWTHLEDRLFFLSIGKHGAYAYVEENTYDIRKRPGSLMTKLHALEKAYTRFLWHVNSLHIYDEQKKREEQYRFHRMFFRTYIKHIQPVRSTIHFVKMLWYK